MNSAQTAHQMAGNSGVFNVASAKKRSAAGALKIISPGVNFAVNPYADFVRKWVKQ